MKITDDRSIQDIQKEFQAHFPYLKIEFYNTEHTVREGSLADHLFKDTSKTIANIRRKNTEGNFSINGHLKVKTLEQKFIDQYGLNVQVFRRSGDTWLQTVTTDDWTLSEQNNRAEQYNKTLEN